jgi:glycosyltransferase involved in cell wall biosynthesis
MHIVNIMFSKGGGGIEQSFVDYSEGLIRRGHRLSVFTHPEALVNKQLNAIGIKPYTMRNMGQWDPLATLRLQLKLRYLKPDVVLAHTGRSFGFAKRALKGRVPLVGVAHNYNDKVKKMSAADGVFAITHDVIRFLVEQQIPQERIFHIPNMIKCETLPMRGAPNNTPVIGSLGRFVEKKGFTIFIDALKILHERGYRFKAILGGEGEEERSLKARIKSAGLKEIIQLPGWIEDKKAFYTGLDIFCLPSLHEPFGIVLLEAFTHGTPVITTDSEGPTDIVTANFDALMVKKNSATEMAVAIARLLDEPSFASTLAINGFVKAKTMYSMESVSERIEKALDIILARRQLPVPPLWDQSPA